MRIRVEGDNVKTWLNGEEMVDLTDEKVGRHKGASRCKYMTGSIRVLWKPEAANPLIFPRGIVNSL